MTLMSMRIVMAETIDSRTEILQHVLDVRAHLDTFVTEMLRRGRRRQSGTRLMG